MNGRNLDQVLFSLLIMFILAGLFIPFSADAPTKQLIGEYLLTSVFADQSWTHKIYDSMNPDNYVLVTTDRDEDNGNDDTGYICNKLLETCEPGQYDNSDTEADTEESDEISEKYLDQDRTDASTPASSTTDLNASEPVLTEKNETSLEQDNFQVYENPTLGVNILYPMEWNKIENQTNRYTVVTFLSPQENSASTVQEKFLLRINNEPTEMSLDEYTKNVNESVQNNSDFQVITTNSTELANNPASSVTGKLKEGDNELQVLDEWTIKDGIVYRIVFYSDSDKADSFQPSVQKILESFNITK